MTSVETPNHPRSADPTAAPGSGGPPAGIEEQLRKLKLDNDDFRFERDRYKASAAQFQAKLVQALNDLDELRLLREEVPNLRQQVIDIAQEFQKRRARDDAARMERDAAARQALHEEFSRYYTEQVEQERARLSARQTDDAADRQRLEDDYADRLRREVVSLVVEFEAKLARQGAASDGERHLAEPPATDDTRPPTMFQKFFGKL